MQQFNIDISQPRGPLVLYVSQGDSLSRFFSVTVTDNGAAYTPPDGAIYTVRFGAPGMPAGWYDTITEMGGSTHPAVVVDENTYTVEIAEQALRTPGENALVLIVSDATGYTLASWVFVLQVAAVPGYDAPEATVYYNALSEQVAQVLSGTTAAAASATLAESWAVGGTGTREGENTNNAQYWAQQAQSIADGQVDLSNYYTKEQSDARYATAAQGALAASAVQSVNGKSGAAVTLAAADVGAAPEFQYSVGSPALTGRKWIDGSDIYAIVIQGTTGAVTTGTYYQFPVSIDMVVSIQGFIQLSGARFWPFPGGVDGPAASHTAIQALVVANGASANANSLYLNIGNSIFASMPFVAILEYTEASV